MAAGDREAVLAAYDPEIELDFTQSPFREFLSKDVVHGHQGLRNFFHERQEEAWAAIDEQVDQLIEAGDGQVVSVVTSRGRGRVSGAEVELVHAGLWTFRDGKIARVQWFATREEALRAAGIER